MPKLLTFASSTEIVRVPIDAVVCITADGNYSEIRMADTGSYVITLQLGQIERRIASIVDCKDEHKFIRIGKSLIVNCEYISFINPSRQKLILSDGRTFRHEVSASKEALKALKELIEQEDTL